MIKTINNHSLLTQSLLLKTLEIAEQAGEKILGIYQRKDIGITEKKDQSPLTAADMAAHHHIKQALTELTPNIPVLSEESSQAEISDRKSWPILWLVDPLDGTKEFIHKTNEFTVNIALIINHEPVLGVVVAPALQCSYFAMKSHGAFKKESGKTQKIQTSLPRKITKIVASRRHGNEALEKFLQQIEHYELMQAGSALKICLVAEGKAHIYPRLGPTCEWDTAAGHAILNEAQGKLYNLKTGKVFTYNCREQLLNDCFIVASEKLRSFSQGTVAS